MRAASGGACVRSADDSRCGSDVHVSVVAIGIEPGCDLGVLEVGVLCE
jgi:hypothetical protein